MINLYETVRLFEDEDIVGCFRSHAMVMAKPLAPHIAILLLLFLFMFPLFYQGILGVGAFFSILILDSAMIARKVVMWYGTLHILTSRRLFSLTRDGFFKKGVHEVMLDSIASLSYGTHGVMQTIFKLGNITISFKGGSESTRILVNLASPQLVLDTISRQIHKNIEVSDASRANDAQPVAIPTL